MSPEQRKELRRHEFRAQEAAQCLRSALAELQELDPAVGYEWDGLGDIRRELAPIITKAEELAARYTAELAKA